MAMSSNRWVAGKYELIEPVGEGGMAKVWRGVTHGAVVNFLHAMCEALVS